MIGSALQVVARAVTYIRSHPQILFALVLIIVMPLLFLWSGQKFLDAGKSNQDRLQKDKVGLMQDVFASMLVATNFNSRIIQEQILEISDINPDITKFRVSVFQDGNIIPIAAIDRSILGEPEESNDLYVSASVRTDESIIFEFWSGGERYWQVFRAVKGDGSTLYYIFTEMTLAPVDELIKAREQQAYFSLAFIYLFVLALAVWHVRLTDYRYLYKKAQSANEMKDLFTNMIAHELRAPLTAIKGYASMIDESKDVSEKERKYAVRIKDSSERLISIVNDLLDVARIQSGKLSVVSESVDVSKVVIAATDELRSTALEKQIELIHTGSDTSHVVVGDSKRLHQAFINLVGNAIKYTKHGSIELAIEEKRGQVEIRIKDTGMGISAGDQKKLFEPFFRAESDDISQITGTGLGMWITRQLIELMGAKIGVESIKGVGTHIVVTLPKEISKQKA